MCLISLNFTANIQYKTVKEDMKGAGEEGQQGLLFEANLKELIFTSFEEDTERDFPAINFRNLFANWRQSVILCKFSSVSVNTAVIN